MSLDMTVPKTTSGWEGMLHTSCTELSAIVFHLQDHTLGSTFRWNLEFCSLDTESFLNCFNWRAADSWRENKPFSHSLYDINIIILIYFDNLLWDLKQLRIFWFASHSLGGYYKHVSALSQCIFYPTGYRFPKLLTSMCLSDAFFSSKGFHSLSMAIRLIISKCRQSQWC